MDLRPENDQQPINPNQEPQREENEEFVRTPTSDATDPRPAGQKAKVTHETKDKRGGNHNPNGANQYTTGRNDDRGRKE